MTKVLGVYFPQWEIELMRRRSELAAPRSCDRIPWPKWPERRLRQPPLILSIEVALHQYVARCCPAARQAGVTRGMSLTEARAFCPAAIIRTFDPAFSQRALELLADWMVRFSPKVTVDPTPRGGDAEFLPTPDGLLLDVTGADHLWGGPYPLLMNLTTRLQQLGFSVRTALAPTIGAAWALARYGPGDVSMITGPNMITGPKLPAEKFKVPAYINSGLAPRAVAPTEDATARGPCLSLWPAGSYAPRQEPSELENALRPLPTAALRLNQQTCLDLAAVGIERIEHLLGLPRASLPARYGQEVLRRWDQACGYIAEPIALRRPPEPIRVRQTFDGPTTQLETVLRAIEQLLQQLANLLYERHRGVRELEIKLERGLDPPITQKIGLGQPCGKARHLWAMLRPRAENLHLGHGVEVITLTAVSVEPIPYRPNALWRTDREVGETQALQEWLDTLVNRFGPQYVLAPAPMASHIPEQACRLAPVNQASCIIQGAAEAWLNSGAPGLDRPSRLLDQPEPAAGTALQPDHPPGQLRWRGQPYAVRAGTGPERMVIRSAIGGEQTRDYFKVQLADGRWLWVFRHLETGQWFVHGLWA